MRYLFIALFLVGCGQQQANDPRSISGINPAFSSEIQTYLNYKPSHKLDYDIPIQFGELDGDTVGLCTRWSNGYRQIVVDQYYWERIATPNERRSLIAHELGHCDLNLGHSPYRYAIMFEYNLGSQDYNGLFNITVTASKLEHKHHEGCVEDIEVESPGYQF